jgi:WD40 repeat protein
MLCLTLQLRNPIVFLYFSIVIWLGSYTSVTAATLSTTRPFQPGSQIEFDAPVIRLTGVVGGLAFSPDSKQLLCGTRRDIAQIWSVPDRQVLRTFRWPEPPPQDCLPAICPYGRAYSPQGDKIAVAAIGFPYKGQQNHGSPYYTPKPAAWIWDVATEKRLAKFPSQNFFVAFSPDGQSLLTVGHGRPCVWSTKNGKQTCSFNRYDGLVLGGLYIDNDTIVTSGERGAEGVVYIWKANNGETLTKIHSVNNYSPLAINKSKTLLAIGGSWTGSLRIQDLQRNRFEKNFLFKDCSIPSLTFLDDGRRLAMAVIQDRKEPFSSEIRVLDIASGTFVQTSSQIAGLITEIVVSPDNRYLAINISHNLAQTINVYENSWK